MANFWLAKKEMKWKSVSCTREMDGKHVMDIELACGRKYRCQAVEMTDGVTGKAEKVISVSGRSYDDPRFYGPSQNCDDPHSWACKEAWDENIFSYRMGVVEKIGISILINVGELSREHYEHVFDYYEQFDAVPYDFK